MEGERKAVPTRPNPGSLTCGPLPVPRGRHRVLCGEAVMFPLCWALGRSWVPVPSVLRNSWIFTTGPSSHGRAACQGVGAGKVRVRGAWGNSREGRQSGADGKGPGGPVPGWAEAWSSCVALLADVLAPQQSSTCTNATTAPACGSAPSKSYTSTLWPMTASPSASALARSVLPVRWVLALGGHPTAALGWARNQGGRPRDQSLWNWE